MKEVKVSTLKKKLKKQLKYVSKTKNVLIVSRKKPKKDVVIISIDEYKSLKEKAKSTTENKPKKQTSKPTEKVKKEVPAKTKDAEKSEAKK